MFHHRTLPAPRLVVTTIAPNGTSGVSQDAPLPPGASNLNLRSVWKTVGLPSDAQAPSGSGPGTLINPGACLPPFTTSSKFDCNAYGGMDAAGSHAGVLDLPPSFSSRLHRSDALGYAVLLSGALALKLGDGSTTHINAIDIVVQRASMHAWHNHGVRPRPVLPPYLVPLRIRC